MRNLPGKTPILQIFNDSTLLLIKGISHNSCWAKNSTYSCMYGFATWNTKGDVCISLTIIQEMAQQIATIANKNLGEKTKIKLKFSVHWLDKFMKRQNLHVLILHGKNGDFEESFFVSMFPLLQKVLAIYNPNMFLAAMNVVYFRKWHLTVLLQTILFPYARNINLFLLSCAVVMWMVRRNFHFFH